MFFHTALNFFTIIFSTSYDDVTTAIKYYVAVVNELMSPLCFGVYMHRQYIISYNVILKSLKNIVKFVHSNVGEN